VHAATRGEEPIRESHPRCQGRLAIFEGAGGVTIAGYVRKPAGDDPFPLVVLLHGGGPTAKAVAPENEEGKAKAMMDEAIRASRQMGRANSAPIPDLLAQGWAVYSIDYRTNPRCPILMGRHGHCRREGEIVRVVDPQRIAMIGVVTADT
jgi:acetyl esterase/lipase